MGWGENEIELKMSMQLGAHTTHTIQSKQRAQQYAPSIRIMPLVAHVDALTCPCESGRAAEHIIVSASPQIRMLHQCIAPLEPQALVPCGRNAS